MSADTDHLVRYKQLFHDSYAELLAYARSFVGIEEADDVVEDAFMELWKRRNEIDMEGNLRAFLYRAVYTHSLNVLRHRKVSESYLSLVMALHTERQRSSEKTPETQYTNSELGAAIDKAISMLPEKCGIVFRMSYEQGMRNKEIASVLGISPKTVEVHIGKALKILRQTLAGLHKTLIFILVLLFFK